MAVFSHVGLRSVGVISSIVYIDVTLNVILANTPVHSNVTLRCAS
jgi:hypothetical protein